jgi:acyl-CoA reductase-like NAD-dependent aldehyde dehydrogenase
MLESRIQLIEDLAARMHEYHEMLAERTTLDRRLADQAQAARDAHEAARKGSWSAAELRELGLEPPAAPRRSRSDDAAGDSSPGGEATTAEGVDERG